MIVFGLTGGIASGKSYVAQLLAELGASVFDADAHAHEALEQPDVLAQLTDRWGDGVTDERGGPDRKAIAKKVFGDGPEAATELDFLEGVIHPIVRERLREDLSTARAAGVVAAVLDVPLLLEAGWDKECAAVLFVDTPDPTRKLRAAERGWTPDEFASREKSQMPIEEKRRRADASVPGDDPNQARKAVQRIWREWVEGPRTSEG